MASWFRKSKQPEPKRDLAPLRELLFGDVPLASWSPRDGASTDVPWSHFEKARRALGVVLEVHIDAGLDVLAAYADHPARFLSHGGRSSPARSSCRR